MRTPLDDDSRAADEMGLTYGKWRAKSYIPSGAEKPSPPSPPKRKRKYTDEQAFELWQQGLSDAEIAKALGVCRSNIQKWRDVLELPLTSKPGIDTKKYRLAQMQDGTAVVFYDNDEF